MRYFLLSILYFLAGLTFLVSQTKEIKLGDVINETLNVVDVDNKPVQFKIPADDKYLIVYKYRWHDDGKGVDNADSIKQLETEIVEILLQAKIKNIKVVCLSYDYGPNFPKWQANIKAKKPFKPNSTYKVDYYNLSGNSAGDVRSKQLFSKITIIAPDGTLLRWSSSIGKFDYNTKNSSMIRAKLITEANGKKEALNKASVYLVSNIRKDTITGTHTNSNGEFEIYVPDKDGNYSLKVKPDNTVDNVSILTRGGREISKLKITTAGFEYKLLQVDIVKLSEFEPDENIGDRFEAFTESDEKVMTSIQTIYYEVGKSEINPASKPKIDKIIQVLKNHPKVKVEITSHTDAQGDDASNLALSEKRAAEVVSYMVANGIKSKRLKAIGKGETEIRNRCKNNVICFDDEHEFNRRTEFKFIK